MALSREYLVNHLGIIEEVEKATMRLVTQALYEFRNEAKTIFEMEQDLPGDIGEDITREALDRLGVSKIYKRLYGKIDYKQARFVFHPDYIVRQALFVDSKTEKTNGSQTATIQMSQTSMKVRQRRAGRIVEEEGTLPPFLEIEGETYLTATIFVKYLYTELQQANRLDKILIVGLPNGLLQDKYNPDANNTIWRAGRNAPSRGEAFRVRIHFSSLKDKAPWRVQQIQLYPNETFCWQD